MTTVPSVYVSLQTPADAVQAEIEPLSASTEPEPVTDTVSGQIGVIDLGVLKPRFLNIPGKGQLFAEPLSKVGASEKWQLYGEIGLEYGPEQYHGIVKDLS